MQLNFVLGTAAELIKVYPLINGARERGHQVRVISTGQSRENFLMQYRDFHLPESELVALVKSGGDLGRASSALKWFLRAVSISRRSFLSRLANDGRARSFVIVHGDTLSTLVGASLGRRSGLPVVHIEAGLRSPNLLNPFPEEITRRLVSRAASFHMAPDEKAAENLRNARVKGPVLSTEGNTLADAVRMSAEFAAPAPAPFAKYALANIHRFENLNSPTRWQQIVATCLKAATRDKLIFVAHPQTLHKLKNDAKVTAQLLENPAIQIRERMPFTEFIGLLKGADYLLSDGGSNQEECSYLGKPCLILREETERREGLGGCCVLSEFKQSAIDGFLSDPGALARPPIEFASRLGPSAIILETLEKTETRPE